jgi:hypothetical protein
MRRTKRPVALSEFEGGKKEVLVGECALMGDPSGLGVYGGHKGNGIA